MLTEELSRDEPDYMEAGGVLSERVTQLVHSLQKDVSRIVTFSNDDLQVSTSSHTQLV